MAINAISYLTGNTSYETGMFKRATVGANLKPTLTGSFRWWNKVDATSSQYLIYTDSYTTNTTSQANAIPTAWSTPNLTDQALVNLINTIPERIGQLPFTNINPALYWLQNSNKYFLIKNGYENIVTDGLVMNLDAGWYDSYPVTGTVWTDLSGQNHNATLYNGPSFSTENGGVLNFDGSDDYAQSSSFTPNITNKTVMAWCKLKNVSQQAGGLIGIMGVNGEPFDTIVYNETGQGWGFGSTGFLRTAWSGVLETSTDTWVHMCATYSDNNYNLYRNGVLILNTTSFLALNYNFESAIVLGKRHGVPITGPLNAYISGGLVYNRALSQAEVQQNFNVQKARFGYTGSTLVTTGLDLNLDASNSASYPGSGSNWYDISGSNNNGTLLNGPTYSSEGKGSIDFDGTDDRVYIARNEIFFTNTFSWEFWVKFQAFPNYYSGLVWAEGSSGGGSGLQYLLTLGGGTGDKFFHYRIYNTGSAWANTDTGVINFTPTNWTHIVWVFTAGTTLIYTQGSLFTYDTSRGNYNGGSDSPVYLAGRNDGIYTSDALFGMVNHYNIALNSTQVLSNYNATKSRFGL